MQLVTLPFADTTITLYNKHEGKDVATGKTFTRYLRTVLEGCTWGKSDAVMTVGTVTVGSDDFRVQVPEDDAYIDPWEWAEMPNDVMPTYFTIQPGDVVVNGEVDDEIPYNTSPTALLAKYKNRVFTARLTSNNTGANKPLGHYVLQGK